MEGRDQLKQAAAVKHRQSKVMSKAYSITLSALTPANFILVVGAALLSLVAGATILTHEYVIPKNLSGLLALISGALTIIHSKLRCEEYQAGCKKLLSFYRGIAEDYADIQTVDDLNDFRKRLSILNDQFSAVVKNTTDWPFSWAKTRAEKCVE